MTTTTRALACPHCSGPISVDATVCPGCGAVKKMVGGGPSKKSITLIDTIAGLVGGAAGVAVRYFFFPHNAGLGDYVNAFALGGVICALIMYQTHDATEAKPMAVWEKPKL